MKNNKKRKYDDEYIAYINSGESSAVFIVRDVCKSIDTTGLQICQHTKMMMINGNLTL